MPGRKPLSFNRLARLRGCVPGPNSETQHHRARVVVEIAKQFGIAIQDHIIVGKQGHASLKGLKLI